MLRKETRGDHEYLVMHQTGCKDLIWDDEYQVNNLQFLLFFESPDELLRIMGPL